MRTRAKNSDEGFKDFVLDQLADLGGLRCRAMFGGYGLYSNGSFFGIVHRGRLYFKTDEDSSRRYRQKAMGQFKPNRVQILRNYYEVPADILESPEDLVGWAQEAATRP